MSGNNKEGRRNRAEQENARVAKEQDDKMSKLINLNQNLINEIAGLREEKAILTTNLSEMASEIEAARKMTDQWKEAEKELRKELGKKDGEYQAAISQASKEFEEAEANNLEATVLQLKNQTQMSSAELEATCKAWELEKDGLLSEIVAARKETAEITRGSQIAEEAWNVEKENLLSRLAELHAKLELMATKEGSLSNTNKELTFEAESLKVQLNAHNDKLVSLQQQVDESAKQHYDAIQQCKAAENCLKQQNQMLHEEVHSTRSLLETKNQRVQEMIVEKGKLNNQVEELSGKFVELQEANVYLAQEKDEQRREFESLQAQAVKKYEVMEEKHSELLKEKEKQTKTIESLIVENGKLNNQVEELSSKFVELQGTNVYLVQEKDEQRREFESLHAEAVKNYKVMEEKHSELFKEKEEQTKKIESLREEVASLRSKKCLLSLNEATKKCEDFAKKCLQSDQGMLESDQRVLELERQSLGLHADLATAKSANNEATVHLNKTNNEATVHLNKTKEAEEGLDQNLLLQISEEEFFSFKNFLIYGVTWLIL